MNEKQQLVLRLYNITLESITSSSENLKEFLDYSSRFLKYSLSDCILMYAQRPNATQCATYKTWVDRCGVRVKRGAVGIHLLRRKDELDFRSEYVFDAKDVIAFGDREIPKVWKPTERTKAVLGNYNLEQKVADKVTENVNVSFTANYATIIKESTNYILNRKLGRTQGSSSSLDDIVHIPTNDVLSILKAAHRTAYLTIKDIRNLEVHYHDRARQEQSSKPDRNHSRGLGGTTEHSITESPLKGTGQLLSDVATIHQRELSEPLQELVGNGRAGETDGIQTVESGTVSSGHLGEYQSANKQGDEATISTRNDVQGGSVHSPTTNRRRAKILLIKPTEQPQSVEVVFPFERHDIVFSTKDKDNQAFVKFVGTESASSIEGLSKHMNGNLIFEDITNEVTIIREENPTDTSSRTLYGREITGPFALSFRSEYHKGYCSMYGALEFKYHMMFSDTPPSFQTKEDFVKDKLIENEVLRYGSSVEECHARIYTFFDIVKEPKERIKFLKKEYGWGGHGVMTDLGGNYNELHDGKGIKIDYVDNENDIHMLIPWKDVEKRITQEIFYKRFPVPSESLYNQYSQRFAETAKTTQVAQESTNDDQISLFGIKETPPQNSENPISSDELKQTYQTVLQRELTTPKTHILDEFNQIFQTAPQKEEFKKNIQKSTIPEQPKTDFTTLELSYPSGKKEKYLANVKAIQLLKSIEAANRLATPEEQQILAKYTGWGGLAEAFDQNKWANEYSELKALLTNEEYKSALSSVNNAHYTPDIVIKSIYQAVENMGFKGGNILEPSMGTGNFFSLQNTELKSNSKLYGVELDSISGRIAKQLHQNAEIHIKGFEETTFGNNFADLAIGNIPFGDYKIFDKAYKTQNFRVHDYFIAKMIDSTRPGGLVAVITSKGTMDKENPNVRKYIAQRAELVGAIRLPNNTFKGTANTEVTSDILFFQKRDQLCDTLPDWVHVGVNHDGLKLNQYFIDNPDTMLGSFVEASGPYGKITELVPSDIPLKVDLDYAIHQLPKNIYTGTKQNNKDENIKSIPADYNVKNFTFTVIDGDIYFRENSEMFLKEFGKLPTERVKGLCEIRDIVTDVISLQLGGCTDEVLSEAQHRLNSVYDDFVKKYGYIDTRANKSVFDDDVDLPLLLSLENIDENKQVKKSAIFSERTIASQKPVEHVENALDGLAVSICEKANVDIAFIKNLSGLSYEEITEQLRTAVFKNPLSNMDDKYDGWETRDEYLSGNVVEKLRVAKAVAELYPELKINVEALEHSQPKRLSAGEISVQLGSPWIDKEIYEQFIYELMDTPKYIQSKIPLTYSSYNNSWTIRDKYNDRDNVLANQTYGTDRMSGYQIIEECLNMRTAEVRDAVWEGDKKTYVLNAKETYKARAKQDLIKEKFSKWIFDDKERRDFLVSKYNELYNCIVPREYDGSIFSFDGMNPKIQLRDHQKNAVARMVLSGKALLAHEVGAGKTFTYIAGIKEMERIGLANKAIITVPNHLTEQQGHDILQLYPASNILVATSKDFSKQNRQKLISKIATGSFDIVILGHTQFERLTMPSGVIKRNIENELNELELAINEAENNGSPQYTVKQMETSKKRLEAKLKGLLDDSLKDNVITFDQLGIDYLVVDEAHTFKNCPIYTKMRNVAGISNASSQRASDMMMKTHYMLEQNNDRGVTFTTGTPVSNSMSELYIMQKYLQPEELKKRDLYYFDNWAGQFGETSIVSELSPEGDSFRERTRFGKFVNLPELMSIFGMVADIKTSEVLDLDVPEVERENVVCPASFEQKIEIMKNIPRAKRIRNREVLPHEDNMLKLISDARKIGLDSRELDPLASDFKYSKANQATENIIRIYKDYDDIKGTQVVFCDMSTPKESFNIYDDVRNKLVLQGIPMEEIAFIHEYKTELAKEQLFDDVNSGKVRVIFGSTQKCGAGTNMQKRLVALHHLDCPYRPADLQQREGRIIRQGNMNKSVKIFTYVTENSFDSYLWSIVEKKQRFISQIMTNKQVQRVCEDIDETVLNYAEVMALSTGNPIIKEKMELEIEVRKLKMLSTEYTNNHYKLQDKIETEYPKLIKTCEQKMELISKDAQKVKSNPKTDDFEIEILGNKFTKRVDAGNLLLGIASEIKHGSKEVGMYKGFPIHINVCTDSFAKSKDIQLRGSHLYSKEIGEDAVGTIKRIENMYSSIPDILEATENSLASYKTNLEQLKVEYAKPFDKEQEFKEKSDRLTEVNSQMENIKAESAKLITILVYEKGSTTIKEIPSDLESFETEVGGEIKACLLNNHTVAFSCNEDLWKKAECVVDDKVFYGKFFICGIDENDNFCELSHKLITQYKGKIQKGTIHEQNQDNGYSISL